METEEDGPTTNTASTMLKQAVTLQSIFYMATKTQVLHLSCDQDTHRCSEPASFRKAFRVKLALKDDQRLHDDLR